MSSGPLRIEGDNVSGELALAVKPGTLAAAQSKAIDVALADAFAAIEKELGVSLAAPPSRFVRQLDGKDDQGRVRFAVRAKIEGELLVPVKPAKQAPPRLHADERAKARAEKKAREAKDRGEA